MNPPRHRRGSLEDLVRPQDADSAAAAKAARRRASLTKMQSFEGSSFGAALADDLCKADGVAGGAQAKMDAVLKMAKEKGMTCVHCVPMG